MLTLLPWVFQSFYRRCIWIIVHTLTELEMISGSAMEFSSIIPWLTTAFADKHKSMPYSSLPAQKSFFTLRICPDKKSLRILPVFFFKREGWLLFYLCTETPIASYLCYLFNGCIRITNNIPFIH